MKNFSSFPNIFYRLNQGILTTAMCTNGTCISASTASITPVTTSVKIDKLSYTLFKSRKTHGDRKGRHYYTRMKPLLRPLYSSGDPCGRHVSLWSPCLVAKPLLLGNIPHIWKSVHHANPLV